MVSDDVTLAQILEWLVEETTKAERVLERARERRDADVNRVELPAPASPEEKRQRLYADVAAAIDEFAEPDDRQHLLDVLRRSLGYPYH